ncbi:deoxynucleoside kinase [Vibrio sp. PP-XX7]
MRLKYLSVDPWSADCKNENIERKPLYICISGNSGVGKSTLLKKISSSLYREDNDTISIDEKSVHHPLLQYLFDNTCNYGYLIQLNFMVQRALLIKSWLDNGTNLIMERSHLEDYIFVNFLLKSGYITKEQHSAYMELWKEIDILIPHPDMIVFINYPVELSLQHLQEDEKSGIRPKEFPDETTKEVKWITGWHDEYQNFIEQLPDNVRERVFICNNPESIDDYCQVIEKKIDNLRRRHASKNNSLPNNTE